MCNKWLNKNEELLEIYDIEEIMLIQEYEIYELVDFLMNDVQRLCCLVMEAREQANIFAVKLKCADLPYPMTAENVFDGSFDDHPAMTRYLELYGNLMARKYSARLRGGSNLEYFRR